LTTQNCVSSLGKCSRTASVALVRIGDALGLYKTLHERGPMTIAEFATATGCDRLHSPSIANAYDRINPSISDSAQLIAASIDLPDCVHVAIILGIVA